MTFSCVTLSSCVTACSCFSSPSSDPCAFLSVQVSLSFNPRQSLVAGLAVALLLGGVANGVAPKIWDLAPINPLLWLDQFSYTRWGLQALYIAWLTPATPDKAPSTAAFLSQLGFCGLDHGLLHALQNPGAGAERAAVELSAGRHHGYIFG